MLLARVSESRFEQESTNTLTRLRLNAIVVKSFKGGWKKSEKISLLHFVDYSPPAGSSNPFIGDLIFIFANERTDSEIVLDTGEFGLHRAELEPALEYFFPKSR